MAAVLTSEAFPVDERIPRLEATVENIKSNLDRVEKKVDRLEEKMEAGFARADEKMEAGFTRLEGKIDKMKDFTIGIAIVIVTAMCAGFFWLADRQNAILDRYVSLVIPAQPRAASVADSPADHQGNP